ncbi:MAG: efflux RND transporter permease subunit [Thermoguttaceae bacterium]
MADAPPEAWYRAKEEILRHPLAAGQLLSADGKTMLMLVDVSWATGEVERVAKDACKGSGMRVRVTGTAPLRDSQRAAFDEDHTRIVVIACVLVFAFELTGRSIVKGLYMQRLVGDLAWSLTLAAGVIFVVLSVAYRSIRIGLISVIPNLLPLAATATVRAVWDTSLDIASACALVVCLGIAVDDTIHFLTRFQHEMKTGLDVAASIRRTFVTVGNALVMTTVVMMAGFATVLTSQLPTHQSFAAMGCITLGAALLADLIILPALLLCFFRRSGDTCPSEDCRDHAG